MHEFIYFLNRQYVTHEHTLIISRQAWTFIISMPRVDRTHRQTVMHGQTLISMSRMTDAHHQYVTHGQAQLSTLHIHT